MSKKNWIITLLIFCAFMLSSCERELNEEHRISGKVFSVRVKKKLSVFDLRYLYYFQSSTTSSKTWRDIFVHSQDDPDPICKECLKIINEDTGYFYIGSVFSVTTNAGETWLIFDVEKDSTFGKSFPNFSWIQNVEIDNNGKGVMILRKYENQTIMFDFITENYGQTWKERKIEN